jgi:hypothetical protein
VIILSPGSEISSVLQGKGPIYAPLLAWLEREGIPTVDVTNALVDEARRSGLAKVVEHHYRPLGNEVVARTLANQLPPLVEGTCQG